MYEKLVTIEIEIPVTYGYTPGEPSTFSNPGHLADVHDIDFDIVVTEAKIWEQLESTEVLSELEDHAEAEIRRAKDQAKIDRWEASNER